MPRRRMIDPGFWSDGRVKHLTTTERLFFIGLISHADDEGRLQANPAFLRSIIFPYDDFTLDQITEMRTHITESNPNIQLYQNSGEEYLYFKKWSRYQKPSHSQPSRLPKPPEESKLQEPVQEPVKELGQELGQELHQPQTGMIPSQVRLGKSSVGKVSIGKVSAVQEDFTEFISSESDLTDLMTTTLEKYMPRGPTQVMPVLKKFWIQATGQEMRIEVFQVVYLALGKYPVPVLAKSLVKAAKYSPEKTKPANYILAIFDEQMKAFNQERPP